MRKKITDDGDLEFHQKLVQEIHALISRDPLKEYDGDYSDEKTFETVETFFTDI